VIRIAFALLFLAVPALAADPPKPTAAEEKAIKLVKTLKGEATIDPALNEKARVSAVFESATDATLLGLYKDESIGAVEIRDTKKLSETGFSTFKAIKHLQKLILAGGGMSYIEATRLSECKELHTLYVGGMKMTDDNIAGLKGLTKLKVLDLLDAPVGDKAIDTIVKLTDLEELNLSGTKVGDAGAKKLLALKKLKILQLNNTKVTRGGVDAMTDVLKKDKRETIVRW
jgi:Leucine-rich repeat (LRR) protein